MAPVTEMKAPVSAKNQVPDFITAINADYRSQIAHVFLLHGDIYDYCDNTGRDLTRSEEHTSELHSLRHLVCRLLLEKKKISNTRLFYLISCFYACLSARMRRLG